MPDVRFSYRNCSIALYGLLVFYDLTSVELRGHRPLAKFLCIKLIVVFTFYQEFLVRFALFPRMVYELIDQEQFAFLENRVIHGEYRRTSCIC